MAIKILDVLRAIRLRDRKLPQPQYFWVVEVALIQGEQMRRYWTGGLGAGGYWGLSYNLSEAVRFARECDAGVVAAGLLHDFKTYVVEHRGT